jgi:hypothetical protein
MGMPKSPVCSTKLNKGLASSLPSPTIPPAPPAWKYGWSCHFCVYGSHRRRLLRKKPRSSENTAQACTKANRIVVLLDHYAYHLLYYQSDSYQKPATAIFIGHSHLPRRELHLPANSPNQHPVASVSILGYTDMNLGTYLCRRSFEGAQIGVLRWDALLQLVPGHDTATTGISHSPPNADQNEHSPHVTLFAYVVAFEDVLTDSVNAMVRALR